jgi:hypothetical protein
MKNYLKESTKHTNTLTIIVALSVVFFLLFYWADKFFDQFNVRTPIILQWPVIREKADRLSIEPLKPTPTVSPTPKKVIKPQGSLKNDPILKNSGSMSTDQTIADYIRSKDWDYSVAIRLAKSENFWNFNKHFDCNRTNVNKDGSIDRGIFQINSIHTDISPEDAFNCFKNIDYAYNLYKRQGWSPWVAYTNLSYKNHDEIIY